MRRIFVDTLYWIAIISRKDQWHQFALKASRALGSYHFVTTDEVLTDVLNSFSEGGIYLRRQVATFVRDLDTDESITVYPQSRRSFHSGLTFFEARPDKKYSLTDCISMVTM